MEHLSIAPARPCCSSSSYSSCSASAPHERRRLQHQERGAGSQQEGRKELAGKRVLKSPSAKSPTSTNDNTREGKARIPISPTVLPCLRAKEQERNQSWSNEEEEKQQ
ncbi:hypothetical protein CGMCC3_g3479 [Colletotrichum fructicola]|nr:uncharacterized protein CGMCC3_g3479 [Colletotrichum fructicola]KAE9580433.1 hypothetical protein CGMCC3_g3479 [Colletotrichum fructicola]